MSRCGATWQGRGAYWAPEASTNIRHRQHGALSLTFMIRPIPGTDWPVMYAHMHAFTHACTHPYMYIRTHVGTTVDMNAYAHACTNSYACEG